MDIHETIAVLFPDICEPTALDAIDRWDEAEIVACYKRNPKHCLMWDIPSAPYMADHLDLEKAKDMGVYLYCNFENAEFDDDKTAPHKGVYILNRCNGVVNISNGEDLRFHISDKCRLTFNVSNESNVRMVSYGSSQIHINNSLDSRCMITLRQQSKCTATGVVRGVITKKFLK